MNNLLVLGSAILARGPFIETDDSIACVDAIFPKHVIEGSAIVAVAELPLGFSCAAYVWKDGELAALPVQVDISEGEYTAAIQAMLDDEPKTRNYDGILSACSYATSTIPRFRLEGQACVEWRDKVWAFSYDYMAKVQEGTVAPPAIETLLEMMPKMEWPEN